MAKVIKVNIAVTYFYKTGSRNIYTFQLHPLQQLRVQKRTIQGTMRFLLNADDFTYAGSLCWVIMLGHYAGSLC
jgi:hypothetical protein